MTCKVFPEAFQYFCFAEEDTHYIQLTMQVYYTSSSWEKWHFDVCLHLKGEKNLWIWQPCSSIERTVMEVRHKATSWVTLKYTSNFTANFLWIYSIPRKIPLLFGFPWTGCMLTLQGIWTTPVNLTPPHGQAVSNANALHPKDPFNSKCNA